MYDAFLYIVANDGIDTSSAYAYRGQVRALSCSKCKQNTEVKLLFTSVLAAIFL